MSNRDPPRRLSAKLQGGCPRVNAPPAAASAALAVAAPLADEPFGVDPAPVDPRRILAAIALDEAAPAAARVAACRTLIATGAGAPIKPAAPASDRPIDEAPDELTRRSLAIMAAQGRPN